MSRSIYRKLSALFCAGAVAVILVWAAALVIAQDGVGQKIGKDIDQGVRSIGSDVRQGWEQVKHTANQMGVNARVYARLHWDKALQSATIDIDVREGGVVVLKGSVANDAAKQTAERLAGDTVGVTKVVSELAIAPPPAAVK